MLLKFDFLRHVTAFFVSLSHSQYHQVLLIMEEFNFVKGRSLPGDEMKNYVYLCSKSIPAEIRLRIVLDRVGTVLDSRLK